MIERESTSRLLSTQSASLENGKPDNAKSLRLTQTLSPEKVSIPLSLHQQRLWFHQQSTPDSPIYNIPIAYHITGSLNIAVLEQSLREIVQRHEILRTTFATVEGQPAQIIHSEMPLTLPLVDLSHFPPNQQEAESTREAVKDAQQVFDLTQAPLWCFKLIRWSDEQHILLLTIHHIICDHWSLHLFMQELGVLYEAFVREQPSPLPKLSKQYADFGIWHRQWLHGKRWESQLAYWTQQLGGMPSSLKLPTDRVRPFISTYQGARQATAFSQNLTAALKTLSDREQVTLFMTLLTAFQVLLYQYTQQEDMILCSPVAGRHRSETKGLIGYFNNILPLRTDLSGNPNFRELLGRVRQVALGAYKHMDLPFQTIADLPDVVRTPLARAMFALQHSPNETIALPELTISYPNFQNVHNGTANFDLSLFLEEKDGTLTGTLDYKTDLFDASTITQMIAHFQRLLECLVANPEQDLASLPSFKKHQPAHPLSENQLQEKATYVAPQKEIEKTIATVWQDVLKIEKVSIHYNFFELGGHSLILVQVCSKLGEILDREFSVVDLFRYPTISALATYLSQERDKKTVAFDQIHENVRRQKEMFKRRKQLMQQRRKTNG